MPGLRRTPLASGAALGLLVLVAAGTAALLRSPDPERATVASADGGVVVEGTWSPQAPPRAARADLPGPFTAVRGQPYVLAASAAVPGRSYALTFQIPQDVPVRDAVVYWLDTAMGAWRPVPSAPARVWELRVLADAMPLRAWAVGVAYRPEPSAQARTALDSLVAVPPPGAVGYRAAYLHAAVPGDYVVAQDPFGSGGCGGRFRAGREQTKTSLDATPSERVVVVWELSGDGCPPGETVLPLAPPRE